MGSAAGAAGNSVAHYASQGVNRLGVAAQGGAEMAAGVAAGVASVAKGVASAAGAVPRSVAAVVQERTVRDCLLQALCYASSPAGIRERRSRWVLRHDKLTVFFNIGKFDSIHSTVELYILTLGRVCLTTILHVTKFCFK